MTRIKRLFRLRKPCSNCPFLKDGAIPLNPGRLEGIIDELLADDTSTFQCHKTVYSRSGGDWDDDGGYRPSGAEAMCAGAAAYLLKVGRPSVSMRLAEMIYPEIIKEYEQQSDAVIGEDAIASTLLPNEAGKAGV